MRGLDRDAAEHAKALIEDRMARARARSLLPEKSSATPDTVELIHKLAELRDTGIITQEEFETKKGMVMAMEQKRC